MIDDFFRLLCRWMIGLILLLTACAPSMLGPSSTATSTSTIPTQTLTATPAPAAPGGWNIFANQGWQDVHQFVHPGDRLEITATGAWSHNPSDVQISSLYGPGGVNVLDAEAILPSAPVGSLLGRIGNNPPFVIGEHLTLVSEYRGALWLTINDVPDKISDNTGSMTTTILFTPKPPAEGQFLKSESDGYSLVYPPGFYVVIIENGICITDGSSRFVGCGAASLEVRGSEGRTADQIADRLAPRNDLNYSVGLTDRRIVDGEPAAWIDMQTPDGSLILVTIVHEGRVYIWRFGPASSYVSDPGDGSNQMTLSPFDEVLKLYDVVINSFQFLE